MISSRSMETKLLGHRFAETDPYRLIEHLHSHGVEYVLVGETAEIIHGAPFGYRDFDIAPSPAVENIAKLKQALLSIFMNGEQINALECRPITDLDTSHGPVSVIFCVGEHGTPDYEQLLERSWQPPGFDGKVCVAALSDLIKTREILAGKNGSIPGLKARRGDSWHWLHLKAIVQFREENPDLAPKLITQNDPRLPALRELIEV